MEGGLSIIVDPEWLKIGKCMKEICILVIWFFLSMVEWISISVLCGHKIVSFLLMNRIMVI